MNRIFLAALLPFLLTLISCNCGDDNVTDIVDASRITGKWYYQRLIINGTTTNYTEDECGRHFMEFHNGQSYKIINRTNCESSQVEEGNYTITPDTLSLIDQSGSVRSYKIVLLNSNTVVVDGYHDYDTDGEADRIRLNLIRKI